jgi:transketolase
VRAAFIEELIRIAEVDRRIWLVTGDLGYSVLEPFADRFPERYLNAGVAEQSMVGLAAGIARSGAIVFVYSIANFPTFRCLEQIRNDVCYANASVVVVSVGSGFSYGSHGHTHHAIEDLAVMRSLPGITVVSPGDPFEARQATRALAERAGPAYLRLGKAGEAMVIAPAGAGFEVGRLRLIRDGSDVSLVATGSVLTVVDEAARRLATEGIAARVYSAHTLKPFDSAALVNAAKETRGVVIVEEHRSIGGLRSAVAEALLEFPCQGWRFRSLGLDADRLYGTGDQSHLRAQAGLTAEAVMATVHDLLDAA